MAIRNIPPNRRSLTGFVASRRDGRMVASESSLERDLLVLLDFDQAVERYEEQPVRIEYRDARGRRRNYTPDVLVHFRQDIAQGQPTTPLLYEVKYRRDLFDNWQEIKPKVRAGRAYARGRGWRFKLITEREIRTPYLQSVKFLRQYRRLKPADAERRLLLDRLREMGEADPDSLLMTIHLEPVKRAELLPTLWHLVATGDIYADLDEPLTMRSPIRAVTP
jgi:hypothetical protein